MFFCFTAATISFAQKSAQPKPSPTPRRALAKPVVARGFDQFATRDASARLIAAGSTRGGIDAGSSHLSKGAAEYYAGRPAAAVLELKQAIQEEPKSGDAHYVLALALAETGKLSEAIAEYKEVIELATKDDVKILSYYNMGNAYADMAQYKEAIEAYQHAIKIDPTLSKPHNNLGLAYAALGRIDEAIAEFSEAVRLKQDYAAAHFNLGIAYLQLGRKSEAQEEVNVLTRLESELADKLATLIKK